MDTISIMDEVQIKGNELTEFAAITIPIKSYHYLCKMAMKLNVFAHMTNCSIEMDFNYFTDLITIAHMAECNGYKTSSIVEFISTYNVRYNVWSCSSNETFKLAALTDRITSKERR